MSTRSAATDLAKTAENGAPQKRGRGRPKDKNKTAIAKGREEQKAKYKKKRVSTYNSYLAKILKQTHPNLTGRKKTYDVLNLIIYNIGNRLDDEAKKLCDASGKKTVTKAIMMTAIKLVMPTELAKHCCADAIKANEKYIQSRLEDGDRKKNKKEKSVKE